MHSKSHATPSRLSHDLAHLLQQKLDTERDQSCPSINDLLRYCEDSCNRSEKKNIQEHLLGCVQCSKLCIEINRVISPTRRLHHGLFGWYGVLTSLSGKLSPTMLRIWEMHQAQCPRCQKRSQMALKVKSLGNTTKPVLGGYSLGLASAMLLFILIGHFGTPGEPSTPFEARHTSERGQPTLKDGTSTEQILQSLLKPSDIRLDNTITFWKERPKEFELQKQAALLGIYRTHAQSAKDPKQQKMWQERSKEALTNLEKETTAIHKEFQSLK